MATKTVSKLNNRMKEFCEFELNNPTLTITDLAKQYNIPYMTAWVWTNSPVYRDYRDQRLKERWRDGVKYAQKTMQDLAKNGDREAAKYILNCAGYEQPKQVELSTNIIKVGLVDD